MTMAIDLDSQSGLSGRDKMAAKYQVECATRETRTVTNKIAAKYRYVVRSKDLRSETGDFWRAFAIAQSLAGLAILIDYEMTGFGYLTFVTDENGWRVAT